MEAEEVLR